ncbi:hypothetical protein GQR58_020491 [Nymphon striatum]|nr:hypothetical protein GQR58_020491 [Nymphon striatum]
MTVAKLPDKYSVVVAVTKLPSSVLVPVTICPTSQRRSSETQVDTVDKPVTSLPGVADEMQWVSKVKELLDKDNLVKGETVSWAAYHAARADRIDDNPPVITAMLPLFKKALWNVLRDLLQCSGWSEALVKTEIATSGTADSFLKVSHITRTRHAHQVTALALETLQHTAYVEQKTSVNLNPGDRNDRKQSNISVLGYNTAYTELSILAFIRAHRENKFALYVDCLDSLIYLFFALDHFNYSRWVSVHVRDMNALRTLESDFQNHWVVQKTQKRFSKIPIDQVHEQENCKIKGKGGVIGITENQAALQR